MRYLICFIALAFSIEAYAVDQAAINGTLLAQLDKESDPNIRMGIYRNLADLRFEKPEERIYLGKMLELCRENAKSEALNDVLFGLAYSYIKTNQPDSARYYIEQLGQQPTPQTEALLTFLHIKLFDKRMHNSDNDVLMNEIKFLQEHQDNKGSTCSQIYEAYTKGNSFFLLGQYAEALPYMQTAFELSLKLPHKEGYELRNLTEWTLASIYKNLGDHEKYVELMQHALQEFQGYLDTYCKDRPYYPTDIFELFYYSSLLTFPHLLPQSTVELYITKIRDMSDLQNPYDQFNRAWALNIYYTNKGMYRESIALLDSMSVYAHQINNAYLPEIKLLRSQANKNMGEYKTALADFKQMIQLKDSLKIQEQQMQINKLKVQYEVDKLSYDKNQLQVAKKQMQLIILAFVILAVVSLCGYLYYNLWRERRIQRKLDILRANAEESERQKTAFINHIYHEIRTPLNAIAGFSQFITENSPEEQAELAELIANNQLQLNTLIEHLLTVSNLDNSNEQVLRTPTDITQICREEFETAVKQGKESVVFWSVIPDKPLLIPGNEKHLSLIVSNLLNNAIKFTHQGEITLELSLSENPEYIRIAVTDTGCGIPKESHEKVFERFVKLDGFSTGNGLGLYLCRLIATRLNGHISIDPEYSSGTRIVVELPVETEVEGGGLTAPSI